jgi:hypothetical protein
MTEDETPPELPGAGLDKGTLVTLKDRVVARLKKEDSNPRFHARFAERLASTLNRALSKQSSPSPPFRFNQVTELKDRLDELHSLIRPNIALVGKVMLQRAPNSETFETDEEIRFSVTVGATAGVDNHDDVACGIAIFDDETGERVRDAQCGYTVERHPSGRFRFAFNLTDLPPGRYRTRLAFAVRDSGHPPNTAETQYEIRAAAGYIPPVAPPSEASTLPFAPRDPQDDPATEPSAPMPVPPTPVPPTSESPAAAKLEEALDDPAFGMDPEPTLNFFLDAQAAPGGATAPVPTPAPPSEPAPKPQVPTAAEPHTISNLLIPQGVDDGDATQPAVTLDTQVPTPDPLKDIVGGTSWTNVPLPGAANQDLAPPELEDAPDPDAVGPVQRIIDMVRGDVYLMFMGAAGAVILFLILVLAVLKN